jgi:FK506-binding nuclear protein
LKANDGKAVDAGAETPESKKKVQFAKPIEQGPTNGQKDTNKTTEKAEKKTPAGPSKRVVQGVTIEDKKIGTGPVAKKGAKLGMRYIGKLKNGNVFDKNTKGKPFTFRLGKGEVIKGWDVALVGMQVGGERRITIPANMAYGSKALPGIPANSELSFDGENFLKNYPGD